MNECDCPQCNTEQLAFETGRQAQYKLQRAEQCERAFQVGDNWCCDQLSICDGWKHCPTDYRECPLKESNE